MGKHKRKSYVRLSHGSGLAIDSVTHHTPQNSIDPPPQLGTKPPTTPPVRVQAPQKRKEKRRKQGKTEADEATQMLIQVSEGAEQKTATSVGSFNARFLHEGRSSLQ